MKTVIRRYGVIRHNFDLDKVRCPDCDSVVVFIEDIDYKENKYTIRYECDDCYCKFDVETDSLQQFD